MASGQYRKLVATRPGQDYREICEIISVDMPSPGPGEVLIRNRYAGINASDINITNNVYGSADWQSMDLGFEGVGEVVAVGDGVERFRAQDAVMFMQAGSAFREYCCLPQALVLPAPLLAPEMIPLLVSAGTAGVALHDVGEMKSGDTVLVTAAAGGVGQMAVQLARIAGNHVIAVCGGGEKADFLRELGADRIIDHRRENISEVLAREYPQGVDLVHESVGGTMFDLLVQHLARRGRLVVVGCISEYKGNAGSNAPRIASTLLWKSASVRAFLASDYAVQAFGHSARAIENWKLGKIKTKVDRSHFRGLTSVPDALDLLYSGNSSGKVTVDLSA